MGKRPPALELRTRRLAIGMSTVGAARRVGVSDRSLRYWESGHVLPSRQHIVAYARILEAPVELWRILQRADELFRLARSDRAFTPVAHDVLLTVSSEAGPWRVRELVEHLGTNRELVATAVGSLRDRGLLVAAVSTSRTQPVVATPAGHLVAGEWLDEGTPDTDPAVVTRRVVALLDMLEPMTAFDLAPWLGLTEAHTAAHVAELEGLGLIVRQGDGWCLG